MNKETDVYNKEEFFDTSLLKNFRLLINSTNIFWNIPSYKRLWNLICTLLDRLDSAVNYLNNHLEHPKSEEELILFLVYATILKDGIYKFYENIYKKNPKTRDYKNWFSNVRNYSKPLFSDSNCPTDDVFFEYLRALAFAHPFDVGKRGRVFMREGEIHYSPWVISSYSFSKESDLVGLRIYSNKEEHTNDIFLSFNDLKKYLQERYLLIKEFISWGNREIENQNKKWMQNKIDRNGDTVEVLSHISSILENRFIEHYTIDEAIKIMKSSFELETNNIAVNKVKKMIEKKIDKICDCVDELDYEGMEDELYFLYEGPPKMHKMAHYQLEKIFSYLGDEMELCIPEIGTNEEWGLIQAKLFYESYGKKYVIIDFEKMSYLDIKVLITTSLVLGRLEEEQNL